MSIVYLALLLLVNTPDSTLIVSPSEWDTGVIERKNGPVEKNVLLENKTEQNITVSLLSTCDCLTVEPQTLKLAGNSKAYVNMIFDPEDDSGPFEKDIIIRTSLKDLPKALFLVHGHVLTDEDEKEETIAADTPSDFTDSAGIHLDYYYSSGCKSCLRFLSHRIPEIEKKLGLDIIISEYNILLPEVYEQYRSILDDLGEDEIAYPALIIGDKIFQGDQRIESELEAYLISLLEQGEIETPSPPRPQYVPEDRPIRINKELALLPILAAGLLDGINPCAFTTLIFLISSLAVAGRGKREVLEIGLFFTLSVFITYFMIGLGFFQAVRMANTFPVIAQGIKWALITILIVFSAMSFYDYFLIRYGKANKMLLQLPQSFKKRIHQTIRSRVRSVSLIASALVLGFLVSVFELACTGQVYFPMIVYSVKIKKDMTGLLYLLLYNMCFILPLLVVFTMAYLGVNSKAVTSFFQRSMKFIKLSLAMLFLGLAFLTFFT